MVRHTLKILRHFPQDFKVSDHFGTLCIKRLSKYKVDVSVSFNAFYSRFSRFISNFLTASASPTIIINFHQKYSCTMGNLIWVITEAPTPKVFHMKPFLKTEAGSI